MSDCQEHKIKISNPMCCRILASGDTRHGWNEIKKTFVKKVAVGVKIRIKIKNDTDNSFTVYNAGSGGSYNLQKNIITTISMDEGDKLYAYHEGKKGTLLLTASANMDGKVQMLSKL